MVGKQLDKVVIHVIKKILQGGNDLIDGFKEAQLNTLTDLLLMNDDHLKKVKFKDGDVNNTARITPETEADLKLLVSYLNWEQNMYATLPDNQVDYTAIANRDRFLIFKGLDANGRQGNPDGSVSYNYNVAFESERRNRTGYYDPSHNPPPPAPTNTPSQCRSAAVTALLNFDKKLKVSEDTWTSLESPAEWRNWKIKHLAKLKLADMGDIVESTYSPPDPATADPAEVSLYEKKNTLLFLSLLDSVATNEGAVIIKKHSRLSDGIAAWQELTNYYDKDMSAVTKCKWIFDLICGSTIPRNHKGLAAAIDKFKGWIMDHNHFCKPGEAIVGMQVLIYFERYISSIDELVKTKELMDIQEDAGIGTQAVTRTPEAKIAFYYRQAQLIDAKNKTALIKKRMVNASMTGTAPTVDEVSLWDADNTETSSVTVNSSVMELISDVEASYEVYAAHGRKYGQMSKEAFQKLSRSEKAAWVSISADNREAIVTSGVSNSKDTLTRPPPPSTKEDARIPSAGISSNRSRAINATIVEENGEKPNAENTSDRDMNLSIIGPMQARSIAASNGIKSKPPFMPGRFLSSQNQSPHEMIPIPKNNDTNPIPTEGKRKSYMAWSTPATIKEALYDAAFPDILGESEPEDRFAYMARAISSTANGMPILTHLALIDSGANNGLANSKKIRRLNYSTPARYIRVTGIGESDDKSIRIGTFAGKVITEGGREIILVLHEFGECFEGPTIMSKLQLQDGGCRICDTPTSLGGKQRLIPLQEDHRDIVPISFKDGLPFLEMTYPTDEDMLRLPLIPITSSDRWNPGTYDAPTTGLEEEIIRRSRNVPRTLLPDRAREEMSPDMMFRLRHIADRMNRMRLRNSLPSTNPFDQDDDDEYEHTTYVDDTAYVGLIDSGANGAITNPRALQLHRNLVERTNQDVYISISGQFDQPADLLSRQWDQPAYPILRRHEVVPTDTVFVDASHALYLDTNPQDAVHYVD